MDMKLLEKKIDAVAVSVMALTTKVDGISTKMGGLATKKDLQFLTEMTKDGFSKVLTAEDLEESEARVSAELETYFGDNREVQDAHATRIKDLETKVWPKGKPEPAH